MAVYTGKKTPFVTSRGPHLVGIYHVLSQTAFIFPKVEAVPKFGELKHTCHLQCLQCLRTRFWKPSIICWDSYNNIVIVCNSNVLCSSTERDRAPIICESKGHFVQNRKLVLMKEMLHQFPAVSHTTELYTC